MFAALLGLACAPTGGADTSASGGDTSGAAIEDTSLEEAVDTSAGAPDDTSSEGLDVAPQVFTYDRSVTAGNPLQGFMTAYTWGEPITDFPSSMEFAYVPLAELMDGPGSFTFDAGLEPLLEAASARGHQLVLRPTIDYPGQPSGLPAFLEGSVAQRSYDDYGGGLSPDYEDADLRAALSAFIAALGDRYDGDPRLAFLQVGLLGHWGEWHTYPNSDWFASEDVQREVLEAYELAFPTTHAQVRYPAVDSPSRRIGFHDDSFAYSTVGDIDWFFANLLEDAGAGDRWREVPVGGELRPELQSLIFEDDYTPDTYAQDFDDCVQATHASYLLNYGAFGQEYETASERARAEEAALSLGYELWVSEARFDEGVATIRVESVGVAPFYYPLELVLDVGGEVLREPLSSAPGGAVEIAFVTSSMPSTDAPWRVSLGSTHLIEGQEIRLANAEGEGTWISAR